MARNNPADLQISQFELEQIDLEMEAERLELTTTEVSQLKAVPITGNFRTYKLRHNKGMSELEVRLVELDNANLAKDLDNRAIIPDDLMELIDDKRYTNLVRARIETEGITPIRRLADFAKRKADNPNHYFMKSLGLKNWAKITAENADKFRLNARKVKRLLKRLGSSLGQAEAVIWRYIAKTGNWDNLGEMVDLARTKKTPGTYLLKCLQNELNGRRLKTA